MVDSQLEFHTVKKDRKLTSTVNLFLFSDFTAFLDLFYAEIVLKWPNIREKITFVK